MGYPANRQRIASFFPTPHRFVFVASDRQRIASIGGRGNCCSRHSGLVRSRSSVACVRAGDYAGNLTNWRENTRCAARPPASGATRPRRSRPAMQAGTATSRRRRCRLRPTFKGVMRCRMESPSDEAMRCRFATTRSSPSLTCTGNLINWSGWSPGSKWSRSGTTVPWSSWATSLIGVRMSLGLSTWYSTY